MSRLMVGYFEEVGLSMNLENFVDIGRPTCFEIVARPPAWLLYSFVTQISLLSDILEMKYMKHVLAQRPIILVLMMINPCTYNTNDLVFFKFQIFNKILVDV